MKIAGIAPWMGSKRTMAPEIVRQLGPHQYYFEGCCGSMSVLLAKDPCEHEMVCDLHGALTNLAWILQQEGTAVELFNRLQRCMYSDELYEASKDWIADHDDNIDGSPPNCGATLDQIDWAYHYFIASWMGRNGVAGTKRTNYQIATRWTKGGGSGPLRFHSAVDSIPEWCERLRNVHIHRRDIFEVLPKIEDAKGVAIYVDPPYLDVTIAGNTRYLHVFSDEAQQRLADELGRFCLARVVVSYYADPRLERLYPPPRWTHMNCSRLKHLAAQNKRGSNRGEAPEVLIMNGPIYGESGGLFDAN